MQIRRIINRRLPHQVGKKYLRTAAGILSFVMLLVMLFSIAFIAIESDHDCSGEDCAICACIDECEKNIVRFRSINGAGIVIAASLNLLIITSVLIHFEVNNDRKNPVTDKIQLNI